MASKLNVLVLGGGAREHALAWKLSQSPRAGRLLCAPGNPGIAAHAACIPVSEHDPGAVVDLARREEVDLVVCGPEAPLVEGLTDRLAAERIPTFSPSRDAAQLEGSKAWSRDLMVEGGLPVPEFAVFAEYGKAEAYVRAHPGPCVVKADGLAAGKGVLVCDGTESALAAVRQIMLDRAFGASGDRVVIEERLEGEEFSAMAFVQDDVILTMPASQDHKRAFDGDRGPNTGGMGAYTPVPPVTPEVEREVMERVLKPLVAALDRRGIRYHGVLFPGLMLTADGVKVIEFNCRFGDPECEVLAARMEFDLLEIFEAGAQGELTAGTTLAWKPGAAACVVMASRGYPGAVETGKTIEGLDDAARVPDSRVFHAGTRQDPDGRLINAGGRVLAVTAWGPDARSAIDRAYQAAAPIRWDGAFYRRDIGHRLLNPPG